MRAALAAAVSLLLVPLAGCLGGSDVPKGPAAVSRLAGVAPDADGNLRLVGEQGIRVVPSPDNATLRLGLGPLVRVAGSYQACGATCLPLQPGPGNVIAERNVAALGDVSVRANGPDGDGYVYFFEGGVEGGAWLRWGDGWERFETSDGLAANGSVTGTGHVGTRKVVSPTVEIRSAATEGLESTIFLRGSSRLVNGTANLTFPELFAVLVGDGPITVQVTLTSKGPPLYVREKTKSYVVIETVDDSKSNATFDVFIQTVRAGGETFSAVATRGPT